MTQQLQANTVCCGDPLPVSLQQQHRAWQQDSWNYDADSAVVSVFASPANCFAMPPRPSPSSQKKLHGVGCNSRGQLYHSHSPPESREDTKTARRARGDSLSADGAPASRVPVPRPEPQQPQLSLLCNARWHSANRL